MVYRGHIRNGRVELDGPLPLPEGAEVEITLPTASVVSEEEATAPTLYEQLKDLIGTVPDLPEDLSVNHDHYLYGVPKRQ